MTPAAPLARRLSMLGCVAMGALALGLSACGDGGTAPENATATPAKRPAAEKEAEAAAAARPCPARVDGFLDSLDALRRQLAVGLSYEQYVAKVQELRASYDQIPVGHLTIGCLARAGTPGERALNRYIDATNSWGECLADASCTTAAVEPILQRKWRVASRFLSEGQ
jgi:hypothetical protein